MDTTEKVDVLDIAHQMVSLSENTVFTAVEFSENVAMNLTESIEQPSTLHHQVIASEDLEQVSTENEIYAEENLQTEHSHIETSVIESQISSESVDFHHVLNETIESAQSESQIINDSDTILEESLLSDNVSDENIQMIDSRELLEEDIENEEKLLEEPTEISTEETQAKTVELVSEEVLEFEEHLLDEGGAHLEHELIADDVQQDERMITNELNKLNTEETCQVTESRDRIVTEERLAEAAVSEEDTSVNEVHLEQFNEYEYPKSMLVDEKNDHLEVGPSDKSKNIQCQDEIVIEENDNPEDQGKDASIISDESEQENKVADVPSIDVNEIVDQVISENDTQNVISEITDDSLTSQNIDTSNTQLVDETTTPVTCENIDDEPENVCIDDKVSKPVITDVDINNEDRVKPETEHLTDSDNKEASNSIVVSNVEDQDDLAISEVIASKKDAEDVDTHSETGVIMEVIDITDDDNKNTTIDEAVLQSLNSHIMEGSDDNIEIYVIEENEEKLDEENVEKFDEENVEKLDEENQEKLNEENEEKLDEENVDDPDVMISDEDTSVVASKTITDLFPIEQQRKRERALKQLESLSKKTTGNYVEVVDSKGQTTAKLPCHMLGRNLDNPEVDVLSNGRAPPKPRLGVKVPNMNLTSQILSKEELTQEVMERNKKSVFRKPKTKNIVLKHKLSQRIANKLSATQKNEKKKIASSKSKEPASDSDLLAILEGDEEPDWSSLTSESIEHSSPPVLSAIEKTIKQHNSKNLNDPPVLAVEEICRPIGRKIITSDEAKQLAMKQLMELPTLKNTRSTRTRGKPGESKQQKSSDTRKYKPVIEDVVIPPIPKLQPKTYSNRKANDIINSLVNDWEEETVEEPVSQSVQKIEQLKNQVNDIKIDENVPKPTEKSDNVQETAKRKFADVVGIVPNKKARIIKKKVIWDPADGSPRMSSPVVSPVKKTREINTKPIETKPVIIQKKSIAKKIIVVSKGKGSPVAVTKRSPLSSTKADTNEQQKKRQEITPIKKKRSEVDKLLMDEGAVNMIYSVERRNNNTEVPEIITRPNKQSLISRDDERKNLISKANLVKNTVLKQSTASVTARSSKVSRLRKSPVPPTKTTASRKKSETHDSRRSSMCSPPPFEHPTLTYRDSRIIRRRSSSSFSSTCSSPRRLSVDPDSKATEDTEPVVEDTKKRGKGVPMFVRPDTNEKTYSGKRKRPSLNNQDITDENIDEPIATKKIIIEQGKEDVCAQPISRRSTRSAASLESEGTQEHQPEDKLTKCLKEAATAFSTDNSSQNQNDNKRDRRSTTEKEIEKPRSSRYGNSYKEISIRRHEGLVQIILTPTSSKFKNGLNLQSLRELREALHNLQKDSACRVVLLTSSGSEFCHGLDYAGLVQTTADKRKHAAQELAGELKEFLRALVGFSKLLVAGVHGAAVGLGVTMLPLFDLVLASDKATFSVPATRNGHIPEGVSLLSHQQVLGHAAASELLLACRELTASEAVQHGLVSRVMWPDKFQADLIPTVKAMTTHSIPAMEATKVILRGTLRGVLDAALDNEEKQHIQMWTASECQDNIKKAVQNGGW